MVHTLWKTWVHDNKTWNAELRIIGLYNAFLEHKLHVHVFTFQRAMSPQKPRARNKKNTILKWTNFFKKMHPFIYFKVIHWKSCWHATWWWLQVVTCCCRPKSSLHMTHGWDESCLALDFSLIFFHSLSERRSSGASTRPSFWAVKNGIFKSGYACWYWCNKTHIKLEISWIFSIIFVFMLPWREHERFSLCRCTVYI